jgi:hypothetical protein
MGSSGVLKLAGILAQFQAHVYWCKGALPESADA